MIERGTRAGWPCIRCGVDCLPQELVCPGCGTPDPDLPDGDPDARENAVARSEEWVTRHEPRQVAMRRLAGAMFLLGWAVISVLASLDLRSTIRYSSPGPARGASARPCCRSRSTATRGSSRC